MKKLIMISMFLILGACANEKGTRNGPCEGIPFIGKWGTTNSDVVTFDIGCQWTLEHADKSIKTEHGNFVLKDNGTNLEYYIIKQDTGKVIYSNYSINSEGLLIRVDTEK